MDFSKYFILSHDVLHISTDLVVLLSKLIKVIVADSGLIANLTDIHQ